MTKTKNMQTFFLILGLISAILVAISAFGYNYYSNLNSDESEQNAQKERLEIKEEVTDGSEKINKKLDSQDSILTNLQKGQSDIKNEVKKSSKKKKPDINVQDSPNAVIQVNESGDNIIDNRQTIINQEVGIPEPTLNILHDKKNIKNDKSQFINEFLVDIKTALPIPKVYFIANGNFISDIEVRSPSGVQFSVLKSINKKRAEYSFSNLSEGRYRVIVTSNETDNIIINVGK